MVGENDGKNGIQLDAFATKKRLNYVHKLADQKKKLAIIRKGSTKVSHRAESESTMMLSDSSLRFKVNAKGILNMNGIFDNKVRFGKDNKMLLSPPKKGTNRKPIYVDFKSCKVTRDNMNAIPKPFKVKRAPSRSKWVKMQTKKK